jgi:1,4-dihydroxy-2-naphthoyl-CoA hydrolase
MTQDAGRDLAATMRDRLGGFDGAMGLRLVSATRDEVVAEYEVDERHRQPYGIVHGGVHCGAVETVCSTGAALDAMARGQAVVGLENHTSFVRAVRAGRVRVTGRPITRGRRSQLWEAVARDEQGRVVASGRVRLLCLEPGTELAGEPVTAAPGA